MKIPSLLLFLTAYQLQAQSFRGLAVVDDNTAWVSGSKGHVLRTTNGAASWDTLNPQGYEKKDFRDIHAWDKNTAIIMSSGDSAVILKTTDGGKSWKKVYEDNSPGVFLDAMDFSPSSNSNSREFYAMGIIVGDPRMKRLNPYSLDSTYAFDVILTLDSGDTWHESRICEIEAKRGEALFAGSGSNAKLTGRYGPHHFQMSYVTGGSISRFISSNRNRLPIPKIDTLPLRSDEGCGAFSLLDLNGNPRVVIGGCWNKPDETDSTCTYYDWNEERWKLSSTPPNGYRSCVTGTQDGKILICTGTNGTDISRDKGKNWNQTSLQGYNVCALSGKYLWLAGDKGRIERVKTSKVRIKK